MDNTPSQSPFHDRNPSPPKELLEKHADIIFADNVGRSSYSKHSVFSFLLKLIQCVGKESRDKKESQDQKACISSEGDDSATSGLNIDDDLQNDLCQLWDMSTDEDVCLFLHEYKAVDLLTGLIAATQAPRVAEICTGILANMLCIPKICKAVADDSKFIEYFISLLDGRDGPTLNEVVRLLHACVCDESSRDIVIGQFKSSSSLSSNLIFILNSSTNVSLLRNTGELVDKLFDSDASLLTQIGTVEMVSALLEAMQQIRCVGESVDAYIHILQLLSTVDDTIEALVANAERVQLSLQKYLDKICGYDVISVDGVETTLASALAVYNVLFSSSPEIATLCLESENFIDCLLKIILSLPKMEALESGDFYSKVDVSKDHDSSSPHKNDQDNGQNGDIVETTKALTDGTGDGLCPAAAIEPLTSSNVEKDQSAECKPLSDFTILIDVVKGFSVDIISSIVLPTNRKSEEGQEAHPLLKYLGKCHEDRLRAFVRVLISDNNQNLIDCLSEDCLRFGLRHLLSILNESSSKNSSR